MASNDHGREVFERGHKEHPGKPGRAHAVAPEHQKREASKPSERQAPGKNTPLFRGQVPGVPAVKAVSAQPKPTEHSKRGGSLYDPAAYKEPKVEHGRSQYSPEHLPPLRRNTHLLPHHDDSPEGKGVRSGKRPAAPLASELRKKAKPDQEAS